MFTALIPGYGIPEDIFKDCNYNTYLTGCFNRLFDEYRGAEGVIVFSGGCTDCYSPYKRTEAREMKKWFEKQMKHIRQAAGVRLQWRMKTENRSLSTLENVLFFKPFVQPRSEVIV